MGGDKKSLLSKGKKVKQRKPPKQNQGFIAEHDNIWCGIFLWLVWVSCPGCIPSQLLAHPACSPEKQGAGKGFVVQMEKHRRSWCSASNCSAIAKIVLPCLCASVLVVDLKHNTIWITKIYFNSILAWLRTSFKGSFFPFFQVTSAFLRTERFYWCDEVFYLICHFQGCCPDSF